MHRRRFVALGGAATAGLIASYLYFGGDEDDGPDADEGTDSPTGFDPDSTDEPPADRTETPPPEETPTDEEGFTRRWSSVVAEQADGMTYAATSHGDHVFVANADGVTALAVEDGDRAWRWRRLEQFADAVAVDSGLYLVGWESDVVALDRSTGEMRWHEEATVREEVVPEVAATEDYLAVRSPGTTDVFETATGDLVADGYLDAPGRGITTWRDRFLLTGSGISVYDPASGTVEREIDVPVGTFPSVEGDTVYGVDGEGLVAVDLETGDRRWSTRLRDPAVESDPYDVVQSDPATAVGGGLVVVHGDDERVHALERETGEVVWQVDVGPVDSVDPLDPPVIVDGAVVASGEEGAVALDAETGEHIDTLDDWVTLAALGVDGAFVNCAATVTAYDVQ